MASRGVAPSVGAPFPDLTLLPSLDEFAILEALFKRFHATEIYTYIKSILLAINPFRMLPLYEPEIMRKYQQVTSRSHLSTLPPHIFAIANAAYVQLLRTGRSQSVNISGESGAGKTESFKLIVKFLTNVKGNGQGNHVIEDQIQQINPILEAFGNALTNLNSNSSRFGKFTYLRFDSFGNIISAKFVDYLLEKSRIVHQGPGERNYHIFYYLLKGVSVPEREYFRLPDVSYFRYLGGKTNSQKSEPFPGSGSYMQEDTDGLQRVLQSIERVGFRDASLEEKVSFRAELLSLLAAILHIGNIDIVPENSGVSRNASADVAETLIIQNERDLDMVATLLKLDQEELGVTLTHKTVSAASRKSSVTSPLSVRQAEAKRDTLAKTLYERLFRYIVRKMNDAVADDQTISSRGFIGLLDIFGFEVFQTNDFEQFCINYANERLQAFFVDHLFRFEQMDYANENIRFAAIDYSDNRKCVDLFAQKPLGLISLIEEESSLPGTSASSLVNKFETAHKDHPNYICLKTSKTSFAIKHFAGQVQYDSLQFLEKNSNALRSDLIGLFASSTSPLIRALFQEELGDITDTTLKGSVRQKMIDGSVSKDRKSTLATQFKASLEELMSVLNDTDPFFVRCIKSNVHQRHSDFDRPFVLRQLRYLGIGETIRMRKAGFATRITFEDFIKRYILLQRSLRKRQTYPTPKDKRNIRQNFRVTAITAYVGSAYDTSVLSFEVGDTIIVEEQNDSGTWRGVLEKNGKRGVFKANYVEVMDDNKSIAMTILKSGTYGLPPKNYAIGLTKVFMDERASDWLDRCVQRLTRRCARNIQRRWRFLREKKRKETMAAIELLQAAIRFKSATKQINNFKQLRTAIAETENLLRSVSNFGVAPAASAPTTKRTGNGTENQAGGGMKRSPSNDLLTKRSPSNEALPSPPPPLNTTAANAQPRVASPVPVKIGTVSSMNNDSRGSMDLDDEGSNTSQLRQARDPEHYKSKKEEKVKKFDQLIQSHAERSEILKQRKPDGSKFDELIKSEETILKMKLAGSPQEAGKGPPRSKTEDQLSDKASGGGEQVRHDSNAETKGFSKAARFLGIKSNTSNTLNTQSKDEPQKEKKKADLFEEIIKTDKTVKLSLRPQVVTKATLTLQPSQPPSPPNGVVFPTPPPPLPGAIPRSASGSVSGSSSHHSDMKDIADAATDNAKAKTRVRRSRTISDLRSWSLLETSKDKSEQVIEWLEAVLMEPLPGNDLLQILRNGDILVRLALLLRPEVPCRFAAKGDAFSMQKIAFFIECCKELGVPEQSLFSVNDLVSGSNLSPVFNTFVLLGDRLTKRGWAGSAMSLATTNDIPTSAPIQPTQQQQPEVNAEGVSSSLSKKLQRLSMTPNQLQTVVANPIAPTSIVVKPKAAISQLAKARSDRLDKRERADSDTNIGDQGERSPAYIELVATEKSYINDLTIVIQYLDVARRKQLVNKDSAAMLFCNIEEILSVHQILLRELETKPSQVGETFSRMTDYLKVYAIYCANYPSAVAFLSKLTERDSLKVYLNTFTALDEACGLSIATFLMKPVQRICRYPLLLKRLWELTPADHPDKTELPSSIAKLETVVSNVNERRRQKENSEKIMMLENQLIFSGLISSEKLSLISPARRFIMDGPVWKIFTGDKLKDRHLFLFNDVLILATPQGKKRDKYTLKFAVDLVDVAVIEDPDEPLYITETNEEDEVKRQEIAQAVRQFNEKPAKAIAQMVEKGLVENTPESIASFLFRTPDLSKVAIGEYIGGNAPFQRNVLKAFLGFLDVTGLRFDEALRAFLATFRLPGEAQIIDRIMESFAHRYCDANPSIIPGGADMAHTLVFAIIMLNTALHNPNVDRRMNLEEFIGNFRNADDGQLVPDDLLMALYRSIKDEKLEMGLEEEGSEKITISFSKVPTRLCVGVPSLPISVSIPAPHATVRLKLSGQGLACEPAVISFAESATATFVITGLALGRRTLVATRVGKGARQYAKPAPIDLLVQLPMLQHTLMIDVTLHSAKEKDSTKETVRLGVPTREERLEWHKALTDAIVLRRHTKSRNRSGSTPNLWNPNDPDVPPPSTIPSLLGRSQSKGRLTDLDT